MSGEICFSMEELYTFELTQRPGEHVLVYLSKLLTPKDTLLTEVRPGTQLQVTTAGRQPLFMGLIQSVERSDNEHERVLAVTGISYSALLDKSTKNRVFQDVTATYQTLFQLVDQELNKDPAIAEIPSAPKAASHSLMVQDKPIEDLLIQYMETDWDFLKRLSSHFEQPVYAAPAKPNCQYTVGIPAGKPLTIPHLERYDIFRAVERVDCTLPADYPDSAKFNELRQTFRLTYESDVPVAIGDRLTIDNVSLYVREFRTFLDSGVLSHEICCVKKESFALPKKWNALLWGQSLRAVVKEVQHDTVLVQFEFEEKQSPQMLPFVYTTPYSAGKSTGFYFMPEVEDTIYLRFPTVEEKDAFADGSIRVEQQGQEAQTGDPKVKYIRTAAGKEIMFSDKAIKISMKDKDGNEMHILIDEENGIQIKTEMPIELTSEKEISLSAKKNIELSAQEIKLSGKNCEASLASALTLKGEIKMG